MNHLQMCIFFHAMFNYQSVGQPKMSDLFITYVGLMIGLTLEL